VLTVMQQNSVVSATHVTVYKLYLMLRTSCESVDPKLSDVAQKPKGN